MVIMHSQREKLQPGDTIPDFTLRNIDGENVSPGEFREKILVIIFMCNHCPYVKPKMAEIAAIQNEYAKRDVTVLCINANDAVQYPEDDVEHMEKVAKESGYHYYLHDEEQDVAKAFGAVCTPDAFVFNAQHNLVYHGRINNAMNPRDEPTKHDMREVLDALLNEQKISEWFKPSMGCSIKWK